ncbi:MAG: P-type conjugative transfer protein TrbJ [Hyphomicrobiaceae bacterium]|nr:P-type conjugative transfer protein TrbJ [Hyphomicrobiaceae bacterium]
MPVVAGVVAWCTPQAAAQLTVFDPANFQQNLATAARALEQINNQVRLLQNQALMIARMDQNLKRLGPTLSPDLQRTLSALQGQLTAGQGIALRLSATQSGYEQLFPRRTSAALTDDVALRNAKARWDEAYAVFERSALVQGQVADGIGSDTSLLAAAMGRSRNAGGALEAAQAGNELTSLNVKQSLALLALLAAQHRAETTAKARDLAAEDEARQRFKTFLGNGTAYAARK